MVAQKCFSSLFPISLLITHNILFAFLPAPDSSTQAVTELSAVDQVSLLYPNSLLRHIRPGSTDSLMLHPHILHHAVLGTGCTQPEQDTITKQGLQTEDIL